MSIQDNTEQILKSMHVMLSRGQSYGGNPDKIIVDKKKMLELLKELNECMYAMLEDHELTRQSRDKAEREFRKRGDEIVLDASRKAEDIYAASIMYTDEALNSIQEIMQKAKNKVGDIYAEMDKKLEEQSRIVRSNQLELTSQLQDLSDTDKYLKLIEEQNRKKQKEQEEKEGKVKKEIDNTEKKEPSIYANRQTEIKINPAYFEKAGIQMGESPLAETAADFEDEAPKHVQPEVKVNLDSAYFRWKNGGK